MNDKFFEHVVDEKYLADVLGVEITETSVECSLDVLTEDKLNELYQLMKVKNRMRDIL